MVTVGSSLARSSSLLTRDPTTRGGKAVVQKKSGTSAGAERETDRFALLRAEARYHRERLDLYKARLYRGRTPNMARLRELERAAEGAAARLRKAEGVES
jgi:hypothetical protein